MGEAQRPFAPQRGADGPAGFLPLAGSVIFVLKATVRQPERRLRTLTSGRRLHLRPHSNAPRKPSTLEEIVCVTPNPNSRSILTPKRHPSAMYAGPTVGPRCRFGGLADSGRRADRLGLWPAGRHFFRSHGVDARADGYLRGGHDHAATRRQRHDQTPAMPYPRLPGRPRRRHRRLPACPQDHARSDQPRSDHTCRPVALYGASRKCASPFWRSAHRGGDRTPSGWTEDAQQAVLQSR